MALKARSPVYNSVRQHRSVGTTPAVAAGLEEKPWRLEKVVEMDQSLFSEESGGLGLAKSKSSVHSASQDHVFRQSTSGNHMLKMWQGDQGKCQMAQG